MNLGKFSDNLFKDFDFTGVKVSVSPTGKWRRY